MSTGIFTEFPRHSRPLTPLMRFVWTCVAAGGGLGSIITFATMSARFEKIHQDFVGDSSKLPLVVRQVFLWQRFLSDNLPILALFIVLPLIIWIWLADSPRAVRLGALTFVGLLSTQGLVSVFVAASYMPAALAPLSGP